LPLDVRQHLEVLVHDGEPLAGNLAVTGGQRPSNAEWIRELQPETAPGVERLLKEALERLEAAGAPLRRLAVLRALRQPGAHAERDGCAAQQIAGGVAYEAEHLVDLRWRGEDVDLVDHDDDLLAPVTDRLQERTFRFGERAVGRRHEEHQV